MKDEIQPLSDSAESLQNTLQQRVSGSRRISNYLVGSIVTIGGVGFIFASLSSYLGKNLVPIGNPASLIFVPQGLVMGIYGVAAILLSFYLWSLVAIDFGSGINSFDKRSGILLVQRRGFLKEIKVEIPIEDIKAVKIELREGVNTRRRIVLRVQGRNDLPLSGVGQPIPISELELEGAELARFLGVNLEGI